MSEHFSLSRLVAFGIVSALLSSACARGAHENLNPPSVDLTRASVESRQHLEAGDVQKAVEALKAPLREVPGNKEWMAEAAAALDEIDAIAESAFRRKNYPWAERIFRVLLDSYAEFERAGVRLTFQRSDLEAGLRKCRIAAVDAAAGEPLKSGDAVKALDVYAAALKEHPGDKDIAARILRITQEIKTAADKALDGKDWAQAGKLSWALIQRYSFLEELALRLVFGKPDLEAAIAQCRENLTKAGLSEYRNGNLARAVAVWESLLAFDPGNVEIKKAVETAKTQLTGIIKK